MYPHLKYQTELFRFDNDLEQTFDDEGATNLMTWKFDFSRKNDTLTFAVLGMYKIFLQDQTGDKMKNLYILNAGRVFEIGFYDPKDNDDFKILEECYTLVYNDILRIYNEKLKNSSLKRLSFPNINVEAFHANMHIRLSRLNS